MAAQGGGPAFSLEEEDAILHSRIYNDHRGLKRIASKFYALSTSSGTDAINDARESFITELETLKLTMSKSALICEAEARQVEDYQQERQRIDEEHGRLQGEIEQLKLALQRAQTIRAQKIEYDHIASSINSIPSRAEAQSEILALESDIDAIRNEHETQSRILLQQKTALEQVVGQLLALRQVGKDADEPAEPIAAPTPGVDLDAASTPAAPMDDDKKDGSDIEMGEVSETPKGKRRREDMEEGEATDGSSELSDPPDD
ncbi:hypothetical protein CYLTODRAFT_396194 [Cylindrobasidium torrendii FP15055 ss-10]|uniref:Uncharacterized protein n=1 Tax=Cylindrobasidium torrendii FP15055 ss-10 TaxID=1314674 RepID=A0A0D7BBQ9_9AGAR|nr:hypothetical protein CYLTODRAFT_396194 [Cylindrobasidium torrendii FP15055 ss-10]